MEVFILVPIAIGAVLIGVLWSRGVDEAWREVGGQLGLRFNSGGPFGKRTLTGDIDGFRVLVETRNRGKQQYTFHRVSYPSLGLVGLKLKKEGFFSGLSRMVGAQDIETGDAQFDQSVIVQGKSPKRITSFLTPTRRVRIHRLLAALPQSVIGDDGVEYQRSGTVRNKEVLAATIRRLCRFARTLREEAPQDSPFARAVEAKRDGQLDEALEHLDEEHDDDVDAHVVRGEILLTAGQPAAAMEVLTRASKQVPDDTEVAAMIEEARAHAVASVAQPRPDVSPSPPVESPTLEAGERTSPAPAVGVTEGSDLRPLIPLDERAVCETLFAAGRLSTDVNRLFAETYAGRRVQWSGKLYRVDGYYSDLVFGSGPGTKAVLEVHELQEDGYGGHMVSAVVQLPEEAAEALRTRSDEPFRIEGELVRCDAFMRNLFLANGTLRPLQDVDAG